MTSPTFEQVITQVNDLLRSAQSDAALTQLTQLLSRSLAPAQQAHAHSLLAQVYEFQSRWDDLTALLRPYESRAQTETLPTAIQQLLFLRLAALRCEQGDLPATLHFARQSLHLAQLLDDRHGQGEAHQMQGKAYRLLGQPAFARQQFQSALNLQQTLSARVPMARSYFGLGLIATGSGEYALARQSFQRAFNLVTEADDPLLYGLLCGAQASTLSLEAVVPLAEREQWFARAQESFAAIGHRRFLARTISNWGDQLCQAGHWQEGERRLQQALAVSEELQDRRTLANTLDSLGELAFVQGQWDRSLGYLAEALTWIEGHDHFVELQVRLTLARVQWQQGQYAHARQLLTAVLAHAQKSEAKQLQAAAHLSCAELALEERDYAAADAALQAAQPFVEDLNSLAITGQFRFLTGCLALVTQQLAEAREALEQARTMFAISERRWWWARTHLVLAEVWANYGQLPQAHQELRAAQPVLQALRAQPWLQQLHEWRQHHPLPPREPAAPAQTIVPPLPLPEAQGVARLLCAVPYREVVLRELLTLLQAELPARHIAFYEEAAPSSSHRILLTNDPQTEPESPALFRLERWHEAPLFCAISPPPPAVSLRGLFKAAQSALELCAARERESFTTASEQQAEHLDRPLPGLLYQSQAMRKLAADIYNIQGSDITVLLLGETGTGKELIAQAIHALSARHAHSFLPCNCATLSQGLAESQLFGHQRGAFTGASQTIPGLIRAAERGTLFLDEIGDLPLEVQPKLLRFLQNKEVHPLGATHPVQVNVRLIAATHHSLEALVEQGKFREDLFHRLHVLPLFVPPLRERSEEIPLLAQHFLTHSQTQTDKPDLRFAPEALDALMLYHWPGNVRELENEILRLRVVLPPGAIIRAADLSARLRPTTQHRNGSTKSHAPRPLNDRIAELEQAAIREALEQADNNITQAAPLLGLTRKGLQLKLKRYDIEVPAATNGGH